LRSPNQISLKFRLALKSIGVTDATFHSLRHTHASALIAAGVDPLTIRRRLGHGSATITLSVYGHLMRGTDAKAAEMVENIFGGLRTD
jgi:integrase